VVEFGPQQGVRGPILDVSSDAAGNVWAISPERLFVLPVGQPQAQSFGVSDGIHLEPFTGPDGSSQVTWLTAVAGAGPGELYLGYQGYESDNPYLDPLAVRPLGNGDRAVWDATTGRLQVHRYKFRCVVEVSRCWENRSVRRIVVGRRGLARGHALFGFNHGATHVHRDLLGDHVHPQIAWVSGASRTVRYGEQRALAIVDDGTMWIGSRYGVGRMNAEADPIAWVGARFQTAFTRNTVDHGLEVPWGYTEHNEAIALTPDGSVWFASSQDGLTRHDPRAPGLALERFGSRGVPSDLVDAAADSNGRLWLVTSGGQLLRFDPATAHLERLPIGDAHRVHVDDGATLTTVWVARSSGLTRLVEP
jgi:hypothetical protein